MSTTPHDLISALSHADMLEIDDLHAWQFNLNTEQLAQHQTGTPPADDAPLLSIECMDGRALRKWHFSLAQVMAARFDGEADAWNISGTAGNHLIKCFAAVSGDNSDLPDDASNDAE
ncbi:DUF5629 family protein [Pseudomonas anguilliseptica]|uniref:DUF5629 family protein n=1 Tax=Pseudomonas anguilliseptica TaxID=53406 RepID=UPI0022B03104|nr:DUF5629 family protein [Pseudomonas anguilliseptica]MCZ4322062.1 DUF5629 family protein [Pseudomonas anguilliseptica]